MDSFSVKFSFKGKSASVASITHRTTAGELLGLARRELQVENDVLLKLLFKGKIIAQEVLQADNTHDNDIIARNNQQPAFPEGVVIPKSGAKVIIMGTEAKGVTMLNSGRSDPLMRGFDDIALTKTAKSTALSTYWGPSHSNQHSQYKFCRFQECTDASFGSRPGASTPHAFEARRLLERLATDPGIVQILTSRELVVGTLGEMDPIDDRIMQKTQQHGGCLLGYNTNHGLRIDVKLRTDDLSAFRPYNELAATLIHELSHNWVGEHNVLFWTNYGQLRLEYLWKHACLMRGGDFANGKRTAALADVMDMIFPSNANRVGGSKSLNDSEIMDNICQSVIPELSKEMAQHHIPVQMVAPAMLQFSKELLREAKTACANSDSGGQRLGSIASIESDDTKSAGSQVVLSARERALAAAEKRAREGKKKSGETN